MPTRLPHLPTHGSVATALVAQFEPMEPAMGIHGARGLAGVVTAS
jgi:hypothetical protein